jgi:hypothetical protein
LFYSIDTTARSQISTTFFHDLVMADCWLWGLFSVTTSDLGL